MLHALNANLVISMMHHQQLFAQHLLTVLKVLQINAYNVQRDIIVMLQVIHAQP